ncbi:WYL domain-containing protein [Tessaracoccus rhinocerotis]|uniref:WYL domain-containing protein n=1 Tax=Tessaracoccus rhinocerotis TaxID=1689449 RepID=A0A553JW12_9ACTN|nr:WYL domain-containing protein [Tessaracoccus rhinocerotis]TRY16629.1 WYL domain-containing protein [Tessaracoccus rhinocerotis]
MRKAKSERLINLLILLLHSRGYVTRTQIRDTIEGYADQSDQAFERMFERDKDELRAAGVPIVTGSNHPDSDEHDGYRVLRSEFELPPVEFTPEELAVLGAANSVWQESIAAQRTTEALETLRAAGADPDPYRLDTLRPRIPAEPGFDELLRALHERRLVTFGYRDEQRRVQPWRLQQRGGRWFLLAFDLDRDAPRHFKLARFTGAVTPIGKPGAFELPGADEMDRLLRGDVPDETATAVVALRDGTGGDLRRSAEPLAWDGPLPEGFRAFGVSRPRPGLIVDEVCALGADAVLLEPLQLRARVVARLNDVVERWG